MIQDARGWYTGIIRFILKILFIWLHHMACGILAPQPEIEPEPWH